MPEVGEVVVTARPTSPSLEYVTYLSSTENVDLNVDSKSLLVEQVWDDRVALTSKVLKTLADAAEMAAKASPRASDKAAYEKLAGALDFHATSLETGYDASKVASAKEAVSVALETAMGELSDQGLKVFLSALGAVVASPADGPIPAAELFAFGATYIGLTFWLDQVDFGAFADMVTDAIFNSASSISQFRGKMQHMISEEARLDLALTATIGDWIRAGAQDSFWGAVAIDELQSAGPASAFTFWPGQGAAAERAVTFQPIAFTEDGVITGGLTNTIVDVGYYQSQGISVDLSPADGTQARVGSTYAQNIMGSTDTEHTDTLLGDDRDNYFQVGAGNDYVDARGGHDTLRIGAPTASVDLALVGAQQTRPGEYKTLLNFENLIGGYYGGDSLAGTDGANRIMGGGGGDDRLYGRGGDDVLVGAQGSRTYFYGGDGNDTVDLSLYNQQNYVDLEWGGTPTADSWKYDVYDSVEALIGGPLGDTFRGNWANNTFTGEGGADHLSGLGGDDLLNGGLGSDTLDGGAGVDVVSFIGLREAVSADLAAGTALSNGDTDTLVGIESLIGTFDSDDLRGDAYANTLVGHIGNDSLYGGAGSDVLIGGPGDDLLEGGDGIDTASYAISLGEVTVDLSAASSDTLWDGFDTLSSIENLVGSDFNDQLAGSSAANVIHGGLGDDSISGGEGSDTLSGGDGTDTIQGNAGLDSIEGGGGNDQLIGGKDDDRIIGDIGDDLMFGALGNDTIQGGDGGEQLYGDDGNDHLQGNQGEDLLVGGVGNDVLYGGGGADALKGDAGDDVLIGNRESDELWGGSGADRFHFEWGFGHDVAHDFSSVEGDRIQLVSGTTYSITTSTQGYVLLTLSGGDSLHLLGVSGGSFDQSWVTYL